GTVTETVKASGGDCGCNTTDTGATQNDVGSPNQQSSVIDPNIDFPLATDKLDFVETQASLVTFAPGDTTATYTVAILADNYAEGFENIHLVLGSTPGGAIPSAKPDAWMTIQDATTGNAAVTTFGTGASSSEPVSVVFPGGMTLTYGYDSSGRR